MVIASHITSGRTKTMEKSRLTLSESLRTLSAPFLTAKTALKHEIFAVNTILGTYALGAEARESLKSYPQAI